jgi:hypothetical protein
MSQASNSQPSRPNGQGLDSLKLQVPVPLHTPSQASLNVVGRQAAPCFAGTARQAPFRHEFWQGVLPAPLVLPHTRPSIVVMPAVASDTQAADPFVPNQHTPWHSSNGPPLPSGSHGCPNVAVEHVPTSGSVVSLTGSSCPFAASPDEQAATDTTAEIPTSKSKPRMQSLRPGRITQSRHSL